MKKILSLLLVLLMLLPSSVIAKEETIVKDNFDQSIEILKELGAEFNAQPQMLSTYSKDNEKIIYFNGDSYAILDEHGMIVKINRISETNQDSFRNNIKNKVDYNLTQKLIEEKLIKDGYELIYSDYFDDTTLVLRYEKKMPYGGHNQYDSYDSYIDTDNGVLVNFKKKGVENSKISIRGFSQQKEPISKKEALDIANKFLENYDYGLVTKVKIGTAIPNDDFFKLINGEEIKGKPEMISEDNIHLQDIRESYILSNDKLEIYLDLYTGDIIGGDFYMYVAGAISAPDVVYGYERATDAHSGLARMGYDPVDVATSVTNFRSRAKSMLSNNLKAFYAGCHGSNDSIGTNENGGSYLHSSEVPYGDYQFVFFGSM